jgi:gamma-glutamyl-gamma-aminobutyrate hydrolase PuuD
MKIALVTCRELKSDFGDVYDAFPKPLTRLLHQQGYYVLALPNFPDEILQVLALLSPSLIVLAGGEDLGFNEDRDITENLILDYAINNTKVKVFGICRGLQLMVTRFGGSITPTKNHIGVLHHIAGSGYDGKVNSFHKFRIESLTSDFSILATAEDGSVEAIKHRTLPWVGWMWHPERMNMPPWMLLAFQNIIK